MTPAQENWIPDQVVQACKTLFGSSPDLNQIQIQKTRKEFQGDQTVVVFPLVKISRKSPAETADLLGQQLIKADTRITHYEVVKGFLNLTLSAEVWVEQLAKALDEKQFGIAPDKSKPQVMVEYSSPNTNKPLHLGHLRNNFLGFSVANILQAAGHDVVKVQIINDRGIHICKSMVAWQQFGDGETPENSGLKGDKLVGKYYVAFDKAYKQQVTEAVAAGVSEERAKSEAPILIEARKTLGLWEAGDPNTRALWEMMNGWVYDGFDSTYAEMGVSFDKLYYESETYLLGKDEVQKGLKANVFSQREDGSVWVDMTDAGMDEKLLLRGDGTAVYMTQDIGTALQRYRDFPGLDRQIYTVGNEQEYHFKVLFGVLAKLGIEGADRNHHLSYGMVELPEGKMKSREGTVVDADDLLEEMAETARSMGEELGKTEDFTEAEKRTLYKQVGYGALKYFLLKVQPKKSMMFDPKASIDFIGNTGPFIQFNHVRSSSVLRKAEMNSTILVEALRGLQSLPELDAEERSLVHDALMLPEVIQNAAQTYDPSLLANFSYDIMKAYSSWYASHPILQEGDHALRILRLSICALTSSVVETAMGLLGIDMPKRM